MKILFVYFCKLITIPLANFLTKKIEGRENILLNSSFIVASNHLNGLDYWFIGNALKKRVKDMRFVAALESFKIFLMSGLLYYVADVIVINRKKQGRKEIIKKIVKKLRSQDIIILFPEGDINDKKELLKGKTGVAELALKTGIPVIPFGIRKEENYFKRVIKIGKPLYFLEERKLLRKIEDNQEEYNLLLRKVTDKIMIEISYLCGKPYNFVNCKYS